MHLSLAAALGALFITGSAKAATLTWALAGGGAWDTTTANWTGGATLFVSDGTQDVVFGGSGGTIGVAAGMNPLSTTVNVSGNYVFSGGAIAGSGPLTKAGPGVLTMNAVNTYTGKTSVQAGTLLLSTSVYLSNAGVNGPLGAPTGADATIALHNGTTFQMGSTSPRLNQITNRNLDLAGTGAGTVNLRVNDNDTLFQFAAVTATGTGAKTFAVFTGNSGNGDREAVTFTGGIADSSDASPTSLAVTFRGNDSNWVNLSAVNTFTGPITLTRTGGTINSILVVGGAKAAGTGAYTFGTGSLANGNYPGAIALGAGTILNYASSVAPDPGGRDFRRRGVASHRQRHRDPLRCLHLQRQHHRQRGSALVLASSGDYTVLRHRCLGQQDHRWWVRHAERDLHPRYVGGHRDQRFVALWSIPRPSPSAAALAWPVSPVRSATSIRKPSRANPGPSTSPPACSASVPRPSSPPSGFPASTGVIDQVAKTILPNRALHPMGIDGPGDPRADLHPDFRNLQPDQRFSSITDLCLQPIRRPTPSPTGGTVNNYAVTVTVTPASSACDILTCNFGALGPAAISGTDVVLTVPPGQSRNPLSPTFTISPTRRSVRLRAARRTSPLP